MSGGHDRGAKVRSIIAVDTVRRFVAAFGVVATAVKGCLNGKSGSGFRRDSGGCSSDATIVRAILDSTFEVLARQIAGAVNAGVIDVRTIKVGAVDGGH